MLCTLLHYLFIFVGINDTRPTPYSVYNEDILDDIMTYAHAVGPDKKIFSSDWNITILEAKQMVQWAKVRKLAVVPWSFQLESQYIPNQFNNNADKEVSFYYGCLHVDGIFHEFPDHARSVLEKLNYTYISTCYEGK